MTDAHEGMTNRESFWLIIGWFTIILAFIAAVCVQIINRHQEDTLSRAINSASRERTAIRDDIVRVQQQIVTDQREMLSVLRQCSGWNASVSNH
jgi:hypothetical protein